MLFKGKKNSDKTGDIASELGFLGPRKAAQNPQAIEQRSVNDIIADLEASDRLREDRRTGKERRHVEHATQGVVAPSSPSREPVQIDDDLPEFGDAQRRLATHRAEIQKILDDARIVEERLVAEAANARAAAGRINLQEKQTALEAAIAAENETALMAGNAVKKRDALTADHQRYAAGVRAAQDGYAAAQATLKDAEARYHSAQSAAAEAQRLVQEREQVADSTRTLLDAAKLESDKAVRAAAVAVDGRKKAERDFAEAQNKASIYVPSAQTLEGIRAIESRVSDRR